MSARPLGEHSTRRIRRISLPDARLGITARSGQAPPGGARACK